jgi:Ca2+-binding RTX toxin-like protein
MVVLGAGLLSAAVPASSLAATVSVVADQGGAPRLLYEAAAGEVNTVTIGLTGCTPAAGICPAGTYTVGDTTATLSPGPNCTGGGTQVTCSAAGSNRAGVLLGDNNDDLTFDGRPPRGAFIAGEGGQDVLRGSPGADVIKGGPDYDRIDGRGGDDDIDPGTVTPTDPALFDIDLCPLNLTDPRFDPTYPCPDYVQGGPGFNTVRFAGYSQGILIDERQGDSETVNDPVTGFYLVHFMRGIARVFGTAHNDQIYGGPRDDRLIGGGGSDVICGGRGVDTVDYSDSSGPVFADLTPSLPADPRWASTNRDEQQKVPSDCRQTTTFGDPVVDAGHPQNCTPGDGMAGENDCLGADTENVIGSSFDDVIIGNDPGPFVHVAAFFEPRGANVLDGGPGNDTIDGGLGPDALIGGPGADTVSYASRTQPVKVSLDGAANDGTIAAGGDLNTDSGLADSVGTDVENIVGGSGNDILGGSVGNNALVGGAGNDLLQGDAGDDFLDGQAGNDNVQGEGGNDQVHGGADSDLIVGGTGADGLDGGDGSDTVDYSDATTPVNAIPDGAANDGAGEGDNLADTVESLIGGSDSDVLVGNGGAGVLSGGGGNDTLDGGGGNDTILGGDGLDMASYAGRTGGVVVDQDVPGGDGEAGEGDDIAADVEGVSGGAGSDNLMGRDGVTILFGNGGDDVLDGRGGDDQIFGGPGNDVAIGAAGNDSLEGQEGDDNLQGGLEGDGLYGGPGDDRLDGGAANDTFTGGTGLDTVVYSARSKAIEVTLDGADNDGEADEHDQIRGSIEGTSTGSGNDTINVRDGIVGQVSCGGGSDVVTADPVDVIADDCEQTVGISSVCSVRTKSVTMSKRGVARVRLTCLASVKGTVTLRTTGAYKAVKKSAKTKKKVKLGSKKFSLKAGRSKTVKVKLSKKGRQLVQRNRKLRVRATISAKRTSKAKATKRAKNLTIKAPKKKKG